MANRKFHVEFDVETTGDGFYDWDKLRLRASRPDDEYSLLIPLGAKITELPVMQDGYYYGATKGTPNTRFLHKRANGKWFFRALSNGWAGLTTSDEDHQDNLYLGPLRGDDTV